ncbi:MAG: hypothetical protein AAF629_03190 [Chloroflexota bacterium]
MTSAIRSLSNYQPKTSKPAITTNTNEVTFVPTLVDLPLHTHRVAHIFQWRRQLIDLFAGFVSGAVSFR